MQTIAIAILAVTLTDSGHLAHGAAPALENALQSFALQTGQTRLTGQIPSVSELEIPKVQAQFVESPQPSGIRDEDLDQALRNINLLENAHRRNEAIEECFKINRWRLSWQQVEKLLRAVSPTSYDGYYTHDNLIKRVVSEYVALRSKELGPTIVVRATRWNPDPHDVNRIIEGYFNAEKHRLDWIAVVTLLSGIKWTVYDSYYTYDSSIERITGEFLRLQAGRLRPTTAVVVAQWNRAPQVCNEQIETYFHAVKGSLAQSDVETLLKGLRPVPYDSYYGMESTKQRIIETWGCLSCRLR